MCKEGDRVYTVQKAKNRDTLKSTNRLLFFIWCVMSASVWAMNEPLTDDDVASFLQAFLNKKVGCFLEEEALRSSLQTDEDFLTEKQSNSIGSLLGDDAASSSDEDDKKEEKKYFTGPIQKNTFSAQRMRFRQKWMAVFEEWCPPIQKLRAFLIEKIVDKKQAMHRRYMLASLDSKLSDAIIFVCLKDKERVLYRLSKELNEAGEINNDNVLEKIDVATQKVLSKDVGIRPPLCTYNPEISEKHRLNLRANSARYRNRKRDRIQKDKALAQRTSFLRRKHR